VCVSEISMDLQFCACVLPLQGRLELIFSRKKKKIKTAYSGELMNMNCSRHKAADV
jgi:hypothetical protein